MAVSFIILAAGLGSRLGGSTPKPLTVLEDGRTILGRQLANLTEVFGESALKRTLVVVGHRAEEIIDTLPEGVIPVYNPDYDRSNTAKSLLRGISRVPRGSSALWLNGDVVFDAEILRNAEPALAMDLSFAVVDQSRTAEEEVKYKLDGSGLISEISKSVVGGLGEAVGINHVSSRELPALRRALREAEANDYFEAAMESTIRRGAAWSPLSTGSSYAVEVDFPEDLLRANGVLPSG